MPGRKNPWWRDSRFVVASIVIPLTLAVIALAPGFFRQRTSNELTVSFVVRDARRLSPSVFDISISERFTVREESGADAARVIADDLVSGLQDRFAALPERERIDVPVLLGDDGSLYIDESLSMRVAVHLTRFEGITKIEDVLPYLDQSRLPLGTQVRFPGSDGSVPDPRVTAGVYRIVLTAAGYRDEARYLQITDTGTLLTAPALPMAEVTEAQFPILMERPSPRPIRVATILLRES